MYGIENPPAPVSLSERDKWGRGLGGCKITTGKNTTP